MNRRDILKLFPAALVVAAVPGVIAGAAVAKVVAPWDAPKTTRIVNWTLQEYLEVIRFGVHPPLDRVVSMAGSAELCDQSGHVWVRNNFNHLNGFEWIALPEERFVIRGAPVLKLSEDYLTGHVVTRDAELPRTVRIWDFDSKNGMQQRHAYRTEATA